MPASTSSPTISSPPTPSKDDKKLQKEEAKKLKKEEKLRQKEKKDEEKRLKKQSKDKQKNRLSTTNLQPVQVVYDKDLDDPSIDKTDEEINTAYEEMLAEMGITSKEVIAHEMNKSKRAKWQAIKNYEAMQVKLQLEEEEEHATAVIERLKLLNYDLKILQKLSIQLRTGPIRWANQFILNDGVGVLGEAIASTNVLGVKTRNKEDLLKQAECVHCIKAILDMPAGMGAVLDDRESVRNLALIMDTPSIPVRSEVTFILAIICNWSPEGYALCIDGLNHYRLIKREERRFQNLVQFLQEEKDFGYKTHALMLLNTLLSSAPEEGIRIVLKKEFKQLGLVNIVEGFKTENQNNTAYVDEEMEEFQVQVDVFLDWMSDGSEQDNQLIRIAAKVNVTDPTEMAKVLKVQLGGSTAYHSYMNVLLSLLTYSGYGLDRVNKQVMEKGWADLADIVHRSIHPEDGTVQEVTKKEIQLEDRVKMQQQQISDLEEQLYITKRDMISQSVVDELKQNVETLESEKAATCEILQKTKEDLEEALEAQRVSSEKVTRLQGEIRTLKEINTDLESQIEILKKSIPKEPIKTDGDELLKKRIEELNSELETVKKTNLSKANSLNDQITSLKNQLDKLEKLISEKNNKIKELEEKLKNASSILSPRGGAPTSTPAPIVTGPPPPGMEGSGVPPPPPPPPPPGMGGFGGPPPPPPPPPGMGGPPPPPPPPGMGGFGGPPPPPPPPGMGGPPPPPPPPGMGGPPPPPPPPGMGGPPGPPPPPGMGGPPPPPGMMGMGMGALPALPQVKPKDATRNFHFEAIQKKDLTSSIFISGKIVQTTHDIVKSLDLVALENMFTTKKVDTGATEKKEVAAKKEVITLIDGKRSYNVSLQLGSLRGISYEQVRDAVINLDETIINENNMGTLKQIVPTQEELDTVMGYDGDVNDLAEPDKFFRVMNGIPSLPERIEAWDFKMKFMGMISKIRPDMESMTKAAKEISTSEKFKKLLAIILTIGNFLNGANARKVVHGFKLKSLSKLNDTKSADGKSSLLQFIVSFIEQKHAEILDFPKELEHITPATRVLISGLEEDINECKKGLAAIKKQIKVAQEGGVEGDKFAEIMEPFFEKGQISLATVDEKWAEMIKELEKTAVLYNEDKKDLLKEPDKFFKTVDEFIGLFQKAAERNEQVKAAEAKRLKQEQEKLKKEQQKEEIKKSGVKDVISNRKTAAKEKSEGLGKDGRGVLDEKTKGLKNGTALRKNRAVDRSLNRIDSFADTGEVIDSNALNSAFSKKK